jgi:hypothetical protein
MKNHPVTAERSMRRDGRRKDRRTDRHDEAHSRLSQFCEREYKPLIPSRFGRAIYQYIKQSFYRNFLPSDDGKTRSETYKIWWFL